MKKIAVILLIITCAFSASAQHIQYRDKRKPAENKNSSSANESVPRPDNNVKTYPVDTASKPPVIVVEKQVVPKDTIAKIIPVQKDTSIAIIKRSAITMNPRPKKPYVEEQNMCNLLSRPEVAPTLPLVINKVTEEMVQMLKKRYEGRLYSITGLNMIDQRLKFKLKICDKDNGKFRSEYLDKDGNVVTNPDFDYQ